MRMFVVKKSVYLALALALPFVVMQAQAETADRSKPIEIQAHEFHGDEIRQVATYTGAVEVHQGTMELLGDKLTLRISPEGYRTLTVTGNPVRMKERRDPRVPGVEEWIHASSLVAVYDERNDTVTLTKAAKLARSENGLVKDSSSGDLIVYDLRKARSKVVGTTVDGKKTRVSTVLAPRNKADTKKPAVAPQQKDTAPMSTSTRLN